MTAAVISIHVYPIKSMAGVSLTSCSVQVSGLAHDREYMLVDDQGVFITQRQEPSMALMDVGIMNEGLAIDAARFGLPHSIEVRAGDYGPSGTAVIWGQTVDVLFGSKEVDDFFSDLLNRRCQLVRMPQDHRRTVSHHRITLETTFADSLPVMMVNANSLHALNDRIRKNGGNPVPMNRFRPNIVLGGIPAFAEDVFSSLGAQQGDFQILKACSRCSLINVNQQDATVGDEPLRTLADFRRFGNKVNFGIHTRMNPEPFMLSVGDEMRCVSAEF